MQRALYQLLLLLALPMIPFRLLWRGVRQPGYLRHVGERFGWYDARPRQPLLWLHAVSVPTHSVAFLHARQSADTHRPEAQSVPALHS